MTFASAGGTLSIPNFCDAYTPLKELGSSFFGLLYVTFYV
jgi:hypothetical protein